MRTLFFAFIAAVLAFGMLGASAADQHNVSIVNATGYPIKFLASTRPGTTTGTTTISATSSRMATA